MKMVVTDLTRMYSGHICVAGINLETRHRVRPVSRLLRARLLRTNGGPFDIGAIVDLGDTQDVGRAPEIEDVRFSPKKCIELGDMPPEKFFELCEASASDSLAPIGPDLQQFRTSLATPELQGDCSLVLLKWPATPRIFVNGQGRLRFTFSDSVELSVTDVRLYQEDLETPNRKQVQILQERLKTSPDVVLAFGLGRPWKQPNDFMKRHYLQLNSIHMRDEPGWQLAAPLTEAVKPAEASEEAAHLLEFERGDVRSGEEASADAGESEPSFVEVAQRTYPNAFKRWRDDAKARLRKLATSERTLGDIMKELGRSPDAIIRQLEFLGLSAYGETERKHALIFKDWSPEEEAMLRRLFEEGASLGSIAKRLGRHKASVGAHAELLTLERAGSTPPASGTASDVGEEHDEAAATIDGDDLPDHIKRAREMHPRAYEPWSDIEDEQLLEAGHRGKTASEIARELGRNSGAIRSRLKKLGIAPAAENQLEAGDTNEHEPMSPDQVLSGQARREEILRQVLAGSDEGAGDAQPRLAEAGPEQMLLLLGELLSSAVKRPKFRQALDEVLGTLTERRRRIIELRFGLTGNEPMTLQEIGDIFGITRERVRQILATVLRRLSHRTHVARLLEALR